ncbi:MAG: hypothetical protein DI551_05240 [Micavibrio aeruginosavorus]|uniref:ArsR family transcriptional regulator n=1 Tax=Micavibrio aeruginosavorus TaxID=349221 RepID=A0A2W5Q4L3_9BACT|nr:MAG: hypothetical protein DI551_05240 [Micavibrio aeruginosavorus]
MKFKDILDSDRRLAILRLLTDVNGQANDSVIHKALDALGHANQPRNQIRKDLQFLENNGLANIEWLEDVMIVSITERGDDAAHGRVDVVGVSRPRIGR